MSTPGSAKRALVLSGGGITGFLYEVGVLVAYDELAAGGGRGTGTFDIYVGTSAGSVLAALLANGASPREIFDAISNARKDSLFYFEPRDIVGVGTNGLLSLVGQFARAMLGTLGRALHAHKWPSTAQLLADFQEHHPSGFYSTEVLQATLCNRFTALGYRHTFAELSRELYVSGTDIDTGEHLVFGEPDLSNVHICRAVAASCALPIFFRPVRMDDRDIVDGAISEDSPIAAAVERGAKEIMLINPLVPIRNDRSRICIPLDGRYCARLVEKGVGWIGEQTLRLMRARCAESALKAVQASHGDIRLAHLEPSRDEMPMFMHNMMSFSAGKELLAYGRESGRRFFEGPGSWIIQ